MDTKAKKCFVKPEMIERVREGEAKVNETAAAAATPIKPKGMATLHVLAHSVATGACSLSCSSSV